MMDVSDEELLISPRRAHMYYDTINGIDQTACGYLLLKASRGRGEVNCGRCLRVLRATERFYNEYGWDCKFQLVDGRVKVVEKGVQRGFIRTEDRQQGKGA